MVYVPNANDATQPTSSTDASTAAAEFRALKTKINTLSGFTVGLNGADVAPDILLLGGGLLAIKNAGTTTVSARANAGKVSGRWYFETTVTDATGVVLIGVGYITAAIGIGVGSDAAGWGYRNDGQIVNAGAATPYGAAYTTGDVIGCIIDASAATLEFFKNGVSQSVGNTGVTLAGNPWYPMISLTTIADELTLNFGAALGSFKYPQANALGFGANFAIAPTGWLNMVINGGFTVSQASAFASLAVSNALYIADRWQYLLSYGAANLTGQADNYSGAGFEGPPQFGTFGSTRVVAPATAPGSGDQCCLHQNIEGTRIIPLSWRAPVAGNPASTATILFWVRSSVVGQYSGAVRNSGATWSYVFTYNITTANVWQKVAIQIPAPPAAVFLETTGVGVDLVFTLASGATFITAANAWTAGNFVSAPGCIQFPTEPAASVFSITGVELRSGSWGADTPAEIKSLGDNLLDCYRYYYKTVGSLQYGGIATNGVGVYYTQSFPVVMRIAPAVTIGGQSGNVSVGFFGVTTTTRYEFTATATCNATGGWIIVVGAGTIADANL